MSASVLITGGLGYLGGRLARHLSGQTGFHLRLAVHRQRSQSPDWLKNGSITHCDLSQEADVDALCKGMTAIIHLAALNEIDSVNDPEKALQVNVLGTLRLLRAAERAGVKRFIYLSTAHVYGAPLLGTITEESPARPLNYYSITHRNAEDYVLAAHHRKLLDGIVLRLSNGFGAPVTPDVNTWNLLVNGLCRQAVTEGKLVLRSSGIQMRDFTPIESVCHCVQHFLQLPSALCDDGLFNVGGGSSISVIDMANRIAARCQAVLGKTVQVERPEPEAGEVAAMLDYRTDKLARTGFRGIDCIDQEIDATLRLCQQFFGKD